jgi:hypothetical protein
MPDSLPGRLVLDEHHRGWKERGQDRRRECQRSGLTEPVSRLKTDAIICLPFSILCQCQMQSKKH